MKKKSFPLVVVLLVLVSMACLCTGTGLATPTNGSSGLITEVVMAKGTQGDALDPVDITTVFDPSSVIHAVAKIQDAPDNTRFVASFYVVDVGSAAAPNSLINSSELDAGGTRNLDFSVSPSTTWPSGQYRVEITVNGTLDQVVQYSVQ